MGAHKNSCKERGKVYLSFFPSSLLYLRSSPPIHSALPSPLRSGPLNPARGLGERCKLP